MMSKGRVAAEELRGQLGERLPGAVQIAARAMGVTTAEFDKLMRAGLDASVFLPRFAEQLRKEFETQLPKAAQSMRANLNRISNVLLQFRRQMGEAFTPLIGFVVDVTRHFDLLRPSLQNLRNAFAPLLASLENTSDALGITGQSTSLAERFMRRLAGIVDFMTPIVSHLSNTLAMLTNIVTTLLHPVINFIRQLELTTSHAKSLAPVITLLVSVFAAYKIGVLASVVATKGFLIITGAARVATLLFTGAFAKLNAVMLLNPVGLVIAALVALVGIVITAYNELDWFRGVVHGLWGVLKTLAIIIKDGVVKVFTGLWQTVKSGAMALYHLLRWDFGKAAEEAGNAMSGVQSAMEGMLDLSPQSMFVKNGEKLGKSWREGYQKGVNAEKISFDRMMGTAQPTTPGVPVPATAGVPTTGEGTGAALTTDVGQGIDNITGGGGRVVNVNVSGVTFAENLEINVNSIEEGEDLEAQMQEWFTRILNGATFAGTQ